MPQTPEERKASNAACNRRYYAANKERKDAQSRQWAKDNPEKMNAFSKKWYDKNKVNNPYWARNKKYNIDFEDMFAKQGGKCLICKTTSPEGNGDGWHVDHNHDCCKGSRSCGECVRGILCNNCNSGLGQFKDNIEFLEDAQHHLLKDQDVLGIGNL
jgi:hypothetical protein